MIRIKNTQKIINEDGFASIIIGLIIVIVLALLTIGFAQLVRREQQTALNRHLADQAYYAAESGVNDAVSDIHNGYICDPAISKTCSPTSVMPSSTQCVHANPPGLTSNSQIDASHGVSYTCLLVNLQPGHLEIKDTPPESGRYIAFNTSDSLNSITIQWGSYDGNNGSFWPSLIDGSDFPPQSGWGNKPPVILFSFTPTTPGTISRASLISNTLNTFLYPSTAVGTVPNPVPSPSSAQDKVVSGLCVTDTNYPCSVTINGLSGSSWVLNYESYYDAANIYITGSNAITGGVRFVGQATVDVTGQAHNVLKRIQVTLATNPNNGMIENPPILPSRSVEAQSICKRIQTLPPAADNTHYFGTNDSSTLDPGGPSGNGATVDGTPDPCNLDN